MKSIVLLLLSVCAISSASARDYSYTRHCAPYVLRTCEVSRCNECRWATNACGQRYSYHVTVVTYRSHYSDGSSRSYSRTYRA